MAAAVLCVRSAVCRCLLKFLCARNDARAQLCSPMRFGIFAKLAFCKTLAFQSWGIFATLCESLRPLIYLQHVFLPTCDRRLSS